MRVKRLIVGVTGALCLAGALQAGSARADGLPRFSKANLKGDYVCLMTGSAVGGDLSTDPGNFLPVSFVTLESNDGHGNLTGHGFNAAPPYGSCPVTVQGPVQVNSDGTGLRSVDYTLCGGDAGTYNQAILLEDDGARYDIAALASGFVFSGHCARR